MMPTSAMLSEARLALYSLRAMAKAWSVLSTGETREHWLGVLRLTDKIGPVLDRWEDRLAAASVNVRPVRSAEIVSLNAVRRARQKRES